MFFPAKRKQRWKNQHYLQVETKNRSPQQFLRTVFNNLLSTVKMASATPAALRSVKPPGSVRGMKKLDKEALSITAQVPGFRVPAKSMHQVCRRQINCCTWIYLEKFFHLCLMQLQVSDAHQGEQKRRHIPSSADPLISVSLLSGAFKMEEAAVEGAQSKTCGGTECR